MPIEHKKAVAICAVSFLLLPLVAGIETASFFTDEEITISDERKQLNLSANLSEWKSFSVNVSGADAGNTFFRIEGERGFFAFFIGIRPWMWFQSAVPGMNAAYRYPSVVFESASPDVTYQVVVNRTGSHTADVEVRKNGENVFELSEDHVFNIFPLSYPRKQRHDPLYVEDGSVPFVPQRISLWSNKPSERAVFSDIVIRYGRVNASETPPREVGPAPADSVVLVAPEWWSVLAVTSVDRPVFVTDAVGNATRRFVRQHDPDRIYTVGGLDPAGLNVTALDRDGVLPVFFPNTSQAVLARGDRRQALAAAQYAAAMDLPVVTEERHDVQELNLSRQALQRRYLEQRSGLNHLVLGNTASPVSALLPRYAARNGAYLVAASASVTYGPDVAAANTANRVNRFGQRLRTALDRLALHGEGPSAASYLYDGMYLTLAGVPFQERQDPVEATPMLLVDDPIDDTYYLSDTPYIDPDTDGHAELGYGRLPRNLEAASRMLALPQARDEPVVAGEYLKQTWAEIALYHGGGLFHTMQVAGTLTDRGKRPRYLVENRTTAADIEAAARSLITFALGVPDPVGYTGTLQALHRQLSGQRLQDILYTLVTNSEKFAKAGAANADSIAKVSDDAVDASRLSTDLDIASSVLDRALVAKDATVFLKAFMEFRFDPDPQGLLRQLRQLDPSPERLVRNIVTHRPELNETTIEAMDDASLVYYAGTGNGTHWILPNRDGYHVDLSLGDGVFNQYNGSRHVRPTDASGLVVDTSSAALRPGNLGRAVLRNGPDGYLGFTAKSYLPYSQTFAKAFIENGFTLGGSFRQAYNRYRMDSWNFDPQDIVFGYNAYWRHQARWNKQLHSAVLYGAPETVKDPELPSLHPPTATCHGTTCTYTWEPETAYTTRNGTIFVRNTATVGAPGIPQLFVHRRSKVFPANTTIVNVSAAVIERTTVPGETNLSRPFPHDRLQWQVTELLDGRRKLTVSHLALRYGPQQTTVYDRIEIDVTVRQSVRLDLAVGDGTATATLDAAAPVNGTLYLRVRNRSWRTTLHRSIAFEDGSATTSFDLDLPPGSYLAEATLDAETRAGPVRERFTVTDDVPAVAITVPPAVEEGRRFPATVTVQNTADRSHSFTVRVNGTGGVQTGFLQPAGFTVTVPSGTTVRRQVPLRAVLPGTAAVTASLGNTTASDLVRVRDRGRLDTVVDGLERLLRAEGRRTTFTAERNGSRIRLALDHHRGTVSLVRTRSRQVQRLRTPQFSITAIRRPAGTVYRFATPRGRLTVDTRDGRGVLEQGSVDRERFRHARARLRHEIRKLVERYRLQRRQLTDTGETMLPGAR